MELYKFHVFLAMVAVLFIFPVVHGWGLDGHYTVCKIAQSRLSKAAADAVEKLLPTSANGDLASVCIWADRVKFHYHWSSPLHYIDTPDNLCNYQYKRDCKDEDGVEDRCVAGAIYNYTNQLLSYNKGNDHVSTYNLTESLLFLSHFFGDIHQPLHVGFTSDRGGNTIDVHWYTRKTVLHHVWDSNIIETVEERYDGSNVDELVDAIQKNITVQTIVFSPKLCCSYPPKMPPGTGWADQVNSWESCSGNKTSCPDIYASEGIKAACDWAYKGVSEDSTLEDDYFLTRYPIVQWRLAQGGVRLAATLNRIFK